MRSSLYLLVALGGALGSVLRYFLGGVVASQLGAAFPWNTLFVNVTGSFIIGLLFGLTGPGGRWLASPALQTFLMVGVCGGYTTFSSFSLNTLNLVQEGDWLRAGGNILASVSLCLVAVWLGSVCAALVNQPR